MSEDRHTWTEADAGTWERTYGEEPDDDRPTRRELAEEEGNYPRPRPSRVRDGILCAHCKHRHETVDDVRWCAGLPSRS